MPEHHRFYFSPSTIGKEGPRDRVRRGRVPTSRLCGQSAPHPPSIPSNGSTRGSRDRNEQNGKGSLLSHGGGGRRGTSSPAAESRPPESSCSPPRCLHFESRGYIPDVGGPEIRGSRFRSCRAGSRKLNPHSRSASASRRRAGSGAAAAAAMKPSPHFPEIGKKPKGTLGLLPATNPLRTQRRLCLRGHFVSLKK